MLTLLSRLFYSIRPSACLGVALFAVATFQNAKEVMTMTVIFLSTFAGAAACFLVNDIYDREKDLLNNKNRPIATGALPKSVAVSSAVTFSVCYLGASIYLGIYPLILFTITMVTFLIYPKINNTYGFLANVLVAVNVALAFVYGGILNEMDKSAVLLMISVFFVTVSREIMLDALDVNGDEEIGKCSVPLRVGKRKMTIVVVAGYFLASIPLVLLINQEALFSIFIITMLAALWLPLIVRIAFPRMDWILFNIRSSHTFFGLLIALMFLR